VFVAGKPARIGSPQDAVRCGIGLLTEDRKQQGLCLQLSVRENITLSILGRLTRGLTTDRHKETLLAQRFINNMAIKASSQDQLAINLSGGTQQKVVLSKWLATEPKVLIFDEPTRGIDVGAKVEIYRMINELAQEGVAILMVSSELPEILGMSDRILVIGGGRVRGFLTRDEANEERIMELATAADRPEAPTQA
jgi:ABC-type sugar transport system ATPase subunit